MVVVAGAAVLVAAALRRLGLAGAAVVGGVAAGVLLGPGVAGRLAPETWTRTFEGPPELLTELRGATSEREALHLALGQPAMAGVDATEALKEVEPRFERATLAWEEARAEHRRPLGWALLAASALTFLAAGAACAVRAPVRSVQRAEALLHATWWCAAAVAATALVTWIRGEPLGGPESLVIAAAACCGPWAIGREDRRIVREALPRGDALLEHSGRIASTVALGLAAAVVAMAWHRLGATERILACATLAALPVGWALRPRLIAFVECGALPALAALACLAVEPFRDLDPLLAVVLYLLLEDARWTGGWLGLRLSDRAAANEATRAALGALAVDPMILAFVGLGLAAGVLTPVVAASMVAGATIIAVLAKARRLVAGRMALERAIDG